MKTTALLSIASLVLASNVASAHPCRTTGDAVAAFAVRCNPWANKEMDGAVGGTDLSGQLQMTNIRCDQQGGAQSMSLSFVNIEHPSLLAESNVVETIATAKPVPPPYGDQKVRLATSVDFVEANGLNQLKVAAGPRFDGSEKSSYDLVVNFDPAKGTPGGYWNGSVITPALATFRHTGVDGSVKSFDTQVFFCMVKNGGVKSVHYTPDAGYKVEYK
jgi:hypothetical protein